MLCTEQGVTALAYDPRSALMHALKVIQSPTYSCTVVVFEIVLKSWGNYNLNQVCAHV